MRRENLGVEAGMPATSTSLPVRDTNLWHQRPNDIIEAYTGNDKSHREDRTSRSPEIASLLRRWVIHPSRRRWDQRPRSQHRESVFFGELSEGLPGFTKGVARVERNAQELGRPERSCRKAGRLNETSSREAGYKRASDQLVVLIDEEGADRNTQVA